MTYKFLSFLFFCGVCVSAFGQELQSPQINQNAIFANPGLAGSKGQTRISANVGIINIYDWNSSSANLINGQISADGLLFKKAIGIGGYVKFNAYNSKSNSFNSDASTQKIYIKNKNFDLKYSNIETGIMIAPKFYLTSVKSSKLNRCISPSFSIGLRTNSASLNSHTEYANTSLSPNDSAVVINKTYSNIELSHLTFGLLYNTSKGYAGIKQSFVHVDEGGFSYKTAFIFAYSFCNKKVPNPKFSFNPQLYLGFLYFREYKTVEYESPYHSDWKNDLSINLDFRYKSILWGLYNYHSNWVNGSFGLTLGVQLKWARIVLNAAPAFIRRNGSEYYLSTSFTIKKKRSTYR